MLTFMFLKQADIPNAVKSFKTASSLASKQPNLDPNVKKELGKNRYDLWKHFYEAGVSEYDKFASLQDKDALDEAIKNYNNAYEIAPDEDKTFIRLGFCYEDAGDTTKAIEMFEKYVSVEKSNFDFLASKSIKLGSKLSFIKSKFGEPSKYVRFSTGDDTILTTVSNIDGKDLYAYFTAKKSSECWKKVKSDEKNAKLPNATDDCFTLYGLKYDSKLTDENDKTYPTDLNLTPLIQLASDNYFIGKKDISSQYIDKILLIDPDNSRAYNLKIAILVEQGKSEEAHKILATLVEKDPKNKTYLVQYGNFLANQAGVLSTKHSDLKGKDVTGSLQAREEAKKKYSEAIPYFTRVTEIDPEGEYGYYYLAVALKNLAGLSQMEEAEKYEADSLYKIKTELYYPTLEKSLLAYEKLRKFEKFRMDLYTLFDMANIYEVLGNKPKLMEMLVNLEGLEDGIAAAKKETYYYQLIGFYSRLKDNEKVNAFMEKTSKKINNFLRNHQI